MCSPGTAATRLGSAEELIDDQADRKLGDLRLEQQDHGGADRRPNANLVDALGAGSDGSARPAGAPLDTTGERPRVAGEDAHHHHAGGGRRHRAVPNVAVQGMRNA